jgi:hypothetical protein
MANRIRVEVMVLKPVEVKKAPEERARGVGKTPFGKMVKCDDFIYIFHGERFAKRGVPVNKTFSWSSCCKSILQTAAATPSSSHLSRWISWAPFLDLLATSCSGATEKGAERFG